MFRGILITAIASILLLPLGCSQISSLTKGATDSSPKPATKILRQTELGSKWKMMQMEIEIAASDNLSILLKLSGEGKVDGFYYLEKGKDIDFQIAGDTVIYDSRAQGTATSDGTASDRFSILANRAQGTTYTLIFHNPADSEKTQGQATVFLEVIYPASGSIFVPVETK